MNRPNDQTTKRPTDPIQLAERANQSKTYTHILSNNVMKRMKQNEAVNL